MPLVLSIPVPGAAIQRPAIPEEVILILKFAVVCRRKAKVKYCFAGAELLSGPAGRYPEEKSVWSNLITPSLIIDYLTPTVPVVKDSVYG